MKFTRVELANWKNFKHVDLALSRRVFVIGPNASGKSNLLDAFRFLHDVADAEGGFQRAVRKRGGVSQIRCLHARREPSVAISVVLDLEGDEWEYRLDFSQDSNRRAQIRKEEVRHAGKLLLTRPDADDESDPSRLSQTHLEQVSANKAFRPIVEFFAQVRYLHVVPQLIRDSERKLAKAGDPYGSDFLEQMAGVQERTLRSRLARINEALKVAVPQLSELRLERDERGVPHLQGLYQHWRPNAGWQTEEHFSDGTLRLLGLLWSLLDGSAPLLLEEPELGLHPAVVRYIPAMMHHVGRRSGRQIIVSTHSPDLLRDTGIAPEEVVVLQPSTDGTTAQLTSDFKDILDLLEGGLPLPEAVLPRTAPAQADQLAIFSDW